MQFGPVPVGLAEGAVLAHSEAVAGGRLRKGQRLGPDEIAALRAAGVAEVWVARPGPSDVVEDAAAARLAAALVPDPGAACLTVGAAFTGRVNLHAACAGIAAVDAAAVHALNRIDPAITLATLAPCARVTAGQLVGTVKIITYAVRDRALDAACIAGGGAIRVLPVVRRTAGLILTAVPGQPAKLNAKGRRAVEGRLAALGVTLAGVSEVDHDTGPMAAAMTALAGEMLLILTGSATSDLQDTAPAAVRAAGGRVARFGMPVDPGNLLFLGEQGGRPVIGLPGCARSPALNGADWVLERIACGIEVTDAMIAGMGVGGLLKEIPIRPQPREGGAPAGDDD
ncbi:MAG: molybdopterin-binding protein [Gemmobacter sp.]